MKFRIVLEYDGTRYSGWQKQKNAKTIQGELIWAVEKVFSGSGGDNEYIDLQGSGRTDAGVHALEQTAHLECRTMLAPHILKMKLNDVLPSDINILNIEKCDAGFHSRYSAVSRQYLYRISRRRSAFEKKYVWWIRDSLDSHLMMKCANMFNGIHDFASFSEPDPGDKSTLVKVERSEIFEEDDLILFRIRASHFLWKMVRRLTGIIVECGRGNITPEEAGRMLEKYSDIPSSYTAPPSGLFLEKVYYPI